MWIAIEVADEGLAIARAASDLLLLTQAYDRTTRPPLGPVVYRPQRDRLVSGEAVELIRSPASVVRRGHADCDQLVRLVLAHQANAAPVVYCKPGGTELHALVRRANGLLYDPSVAAGMPRYF